MRNPVQADRRLDRVNIYCSVSKAAQLIFRPSPVVLQNSAFTWRLSSSFFTRETKAGSLSEALRLLRPPGPPGTGIPPPTCRMFSSGAILSVLVLP